MQKDEQFIEELLQKHEINTSTDDFLLHGFYDPEDMTAEEKIQSIFSNGLKKKHNGLSILSTASQCKKDKSVSKQVCNYVARGRFRVLIHVPQSLENVFFGNCVNAFGDAGNQYGEKCLLDFLSLDHIPSEFIVGVYYTDKLMYAESEEVKYTFIENPNYFNSKINKDRNTTNLLTKIKQAMTQSHDPLISEMMNLEKDFDAEKWQKFYDDIRCFMKSSVDYSSLINQRIRFDDLKTLSDSIGL